MGSFRSLPAYRLSLGRVELPPEGSRRLVGSPEGERFYPTHIRVITAEPDARVRLSDAHSGKHTPAFIAARTTMYGFEIEIHADAIGRERTFDALVENLGGKPATVTVIVLGKIER